MENTVNTPSKSAATRRQFVAQSAAAASVLAFPLVAGAQPKTIKIGVLHPVTGALAYSGQQCREGALMAIEDINKTGIKSMSGAKLEVVLGDAQSTPQAGSAEIERMNEAGVSAVVGAFASAICLAIGSASSSGIAPRAIRCDRSSPSTNSMTSARTPPDSSNPWI